MDVCSICLPVPKYEHLLLAMHCSHSNGINTVYGPICDLSLSLSLSPGAIALAEVLAESKHLTHLDLKDNDIRVAGLMALQLGHRMNQTLISMETPKSFRVDQVSESSTNYIYSETRPSHADSTPHPPPPTLCALYYTERSVHHQRSAAAY